MRSLFTLAALTLALSPPAYATRMAGEDFATTFREIPPADMLELSPLFTRVQFKPVNWAQPPLGCVEEMIPHRASRPCPDLSTVVNPRSDWPVEMDPAEKKYWWGQRRGIAICRADEIMRREQDRPGSQNPSHIELSWMTLKSLDNLDVKVQALYDANRATGVPLHVLMGAIFQESLFAELGIADDGGNFSCGMQQINLIGWCTFMNKQSDQDKAAMGWPARKLDCSDKNLISLPFFKPVYNLAVQNLRGRPLYRLNKDHFARIKLEDFVREWPEASRETQELRYQLIKSYVNNCAEPRKGILAKANELALIYNQFIPQGLKDKDRYVGQEKFARSCRSSDAGNAYPLHTGWLLAVSAYNAGPRSIEALGHYNRWSKEDMKDKRVVENLLPTDIVTSLYWAGRYNPLNDLIEFLGWNGSVKNWTWFKGCVAQRHVARVMQHMTLLPEFFVDTLEGSSPCARSQFDSEGKLVKTSVPIERQNSPGQKP